MIESFVTGMLGALTGLTLFYVGRHGRREAVRSQPKLSAEQERRHRRTARELSNFYTYDGTAQAETDEAALSR